MSSNKEECIPGKDCANGKRGECCTSKGFCKKPKSLKDVFTECIFVEKVFDARTSKSQLNFAFFEGLPLIITNVEPDNLVSIETINAECNIISVVTTIQNVTINGEPIDISTILPGPGGDQVVLNREDLNNILDTTICAKDRKGTKVTLNLLISLVTTFEIVVTGTGIDSNGVLVPFTGSALFNNIIFGITLSFKDFCIPPPSLYPVSLLTSCLLTCDFVLFDFEFFPDIDRLALTGGLVLCAFCDTKLKVPSELCVLTTGPCKIRKDKGFCKNNDFPHS